MSGSWPSGWDAKASRYQKEAVHIGLKLPADDPDVVAKYDACIRLRLDIHRTFALDLGIAENFFADKLNQPIETLRLLH
jgi:hypothetical protein